MSRIKHTTQGTVQTTDTTVTTVVSWTPGSHLPVVNNCIVSVAGTIVGKSSANGGVTISANATFSIVSGTVTLLGSQTTVLAAQGSAALTSSAITIDASSNIIRLRITGIAATTINWTGYLDVKSTEF
jgi:hypothetical protein